MTKEEQRAYNNERYAWLKQHGICVVCAMEEAAKGKTKCLVCMSNTNENALKSIRKRRDKETYNAYMREYNRKRKEKGLCQWCGRPTKNGHTFCTEHLVLIAARHMDKRRKQGKIARVLMGNGCYCTFCGKDVSSESRKLCPVCLERIRKWSAEQRKKINHENHWWRKDNLLAFQKRKDENETQI